MARCWTCGSSVSGNHYRCSMCEDSLREIESLHETVSEGFADLARIQVAGFNQLSDQLSEIATILEWGFGEISWQLQQQTDVLRSIDYTLKTPSETKANEWRLHAEELRRRGVLEESEEFFLKALNEYRLDYRIYVGLAETYLQINKFDKAKTLLEKSLPHAPKGDIAISAGSDKIQDLLQGGKKILAIKEYKSRTGVGLKEAKDVIDRMALGEDVVDRIAPHFDWKSYSYRLIGHIYACEEDYIRALEALHLSIKLSPDYADGLYDFTQYASLLSDDVVDRICSQTLREWGGNWALKDYNLVCLLALQKAVEAKPVYFYLAQKEKNFDRRRKTVELALRNLLDNARRSVEVNIAKINTISEEVERLLNKFRLKSKTKAVRIYEEVKSKLKVVKHKLTSGDYIAVLEAEPIAEEAYNIVNKAKNKAYKEHEDKVKNAWAAVGFAILPCPLAFGIIGAIGGCTVGIFSNTASKSAGTGFLLGAFGGLILGIYGIIKELE